MGMWFTLPTGTCEIVEAEVFFLYVISLMVAGVIFPH